jgi:hypothetical protein
MPHRGRKPEKRRKKAPQEAIPMSEVWEAPATNPSRIAEF